MKPVMNYVFCPREYASVRFVRVQSSHLAIFHRTIFLVVLIYIFGWQIVYKKGYQKQDGFIGSPLIKVKGVAKTKNDGTVYDAADLVNPSLEENAVFIQTNFFETKGQRRSTCSGIDRIGGVPAYIDETCRFDGTHRFCSPELPTANGITTGKCINTNISDASQRTHMKVSRTNMGWMCEIRAWCPLEDEHAVLEEEHGSNVLKETGNFTVFVRVDGQFSLLEPNTPVSNYKDHQLIWNKNLFYLADIVAAAGLKKELPETSLGGHQHLNQTYPERLPYHYFEAVLDKGAEIFIDMEWNCNLDLSIEHCNAKTSFKRVDGGKGFNFRSSNEYYSLENGVQTRYRDLTKRYGVRLVFRIQGSGGKFNIVQCTIVIGSGIGLLGIATILTDVLLYYGKRNRLFIRAKYWTVNSEDDDDDSIYQMIND